MLTLTVKSWWSFKSFIYMKLYNTPVEEEEEEEEEEEG